MVTAGQRHPADPDIATAASHGPTPATPRPSLTEEQMIINDIRRVIAHDKAVSIA